MIWRTNFPSWFAAISTIFVTNVFNHCDQKHVFNANKCSGSRERKTWFFRISYKWSPLKNKTILNLTSRHWSRIKKETNHLNIPITILLTLPTKELSNWRLLNSRVFQISTLNCTKKRDSSGKNIQLPTFSQPQGYHSNYRIRKNSKNKVSKMFWPKSQMKIR